MVLIYNQYWSVVFFTQVPILAQYLSISLSFKDENNIEYFIGLTPTGISVYRNKTKISSYFWPRIYKIDYKDTKFYLTVVDKSVSREFIHFDFPSCLFLFS